MTPFLESTFRRSPSTSSALGGVALISTFVALFITDVFSDGARISGIGTWIGATVVVWLGCAARGLHPPVPRAEEVPRRPPQVERPRRAEIPDSLSACGTTWIVGPSPTLSVGHGGVDFASGAIPALIPFLVAEFDLGYVAAGALLLALTASSSLVQPLFGYWSDRRGALWLLPGGLALAAVGTAFVALAPACRDRPGGDVRCRDRDLGLSPRGREVRGVRIERRSARAACRSSTSEVTSATPSARSSSRRSSSGSGSRVVPWPRSRPSSSPLRSFGRFRASRAFDPVGGRPRAVG